MKTKTFLLILSISFYSLNLLGKSYNKQNTYLDALELAKISNSIPKSTKDTIYDITSFTETFKEIIFKYGSESELALNPFLYDVPYFYSIGDSSHPPNNYENLKIQITKEYSSELYSATSLASASWQTAAIRGISNFMAGRFKQETLQMAINQTFQQIIKNKRDSILIQSIFPKTFNRIEKLYTTKSYYTADLLLIRQIIQTDLEQLPQNLVKNSESIFPEITTQPAIKDLLIMSSYIFEYSQQEQSLDQILTSIANENYTEHSALAKVLNIADLISQALLNQEGSKQKWVQAKNRFPITEKSMKQPEIKYFYGLLYQQLVQIPELKSYIENSQSRDFVATAHKIQELLVLGSHLNNAYNYIQFKDFHLQSPEEISTYILYINRSIQSFTEALMRQPEIQSQITIDTLLLDILDQYISIEESLMKKDYQKAAASILIGLGDYMNFSVKTSRKITFLSSLAVIERAEEMEALLNSYALPIGSSSIKRQSRMNLSINGYVGITGGWETAYGSRINQTRANIGLTAPIGVSGTFARGYLTTFLSFIDLGSVVNQRLNNDIAPNSSLKFENFFAPGLGIFFNFRQLPISVGAHLNYIPNLRTIKYYDGNSILTESHRSVTRANFSLLIDIPFFTLYNQEKQG